MNLLVGQELHKTYGDREILQNVSFGIHKGDRIGLVGINGTGKSTLLKMITGQVEPDEGSIACNQELQIACLEQDPVFDEKATILCNAMLGVVSKKEHYNMEGRAITLLQKLGVGNYEDLPSQLSGGQKKKVALVRLLLSSANLWVLDEPTNHLDSDTIEWLQAMLAQHQGALLMVTHDRNFLDEVCNHIWEIDHGQLYTYEDNYAGYVLQKALREERMIASERKNKSLYKMELAWMMRGARARSTKQKAHIQRFEVLKNRKDLPENEAVQISAGYTRLGKKALEMKEVSFAYGDKRLLDQVSYLFLQHSRIGIVGHNGCGKTTLLRLLTGQLTPQSGIVEGGATVRFGLFAQDNDALPEQERVLDYVKQTAEWIETRDGKQSASQMCERFLFPSSMQYAPIGKLSGGEKRRLYLLKVLMEAPNILILDEPTNDLDIGTLTILEDYLLAFDGIVITVSHDRYFLDKIATGLLVFCGEGKLQYHEGNYTEYREKWLSDSTEQPRKDSQKEQKIRSKEEEAAPASKSKRLGYQEQREYDGIGEEIEILEQQIAQLEEEIAASSTMYGKLQALFDQKKKVEDLLEERMNRWMDLEDKIKDLGESR